MAWHGMVGGWQGVGRSEMLIEDTPISLMPDTWLREHGEPDKRVQ